MTIAEMLLHYLPQIIGGASILAAALPEPKEGSVGAALKTLVHVAALNVGNAAPKRIRTKKSTVLKLLPFAALIVLSHTFSAPAAADMLTWQAPTTTVNGTVLAPADISAYNVIRAGGPSVAVSGSTLSYPVSSCKFAGDYTVTAVAFGLTSDPSNLVTVAVDKVGCRPKAPTLSL